MRIIIADDDIGIRDLIERIARRVLPGATISTAADGIEALRIYNMQGADVLVTDHLMPGKTGLELATELRAQGATLPVLLITATVLQQTTLSQMGNIRHIAKPFSVSQIEQALIDLAHPPPELEGIQRDNLTTRRQPWLMGW